MRSQFDLQAWANDARSKVEEGARRIRQDTIQSVEQARRRVESGVRDVVRTAELVPQRAKGAVLAIAARAAPRQAAPKAAPAAARKPAAKAPPPTPVPTKRDEAFEAFKAGMRGVADGMSFGTADEIGAGVGAAVDTAKRAITHTDDGRTLRQRYESNLAREHALIARDQLEHPLARTAGQVLGTGVSLAASGPGGVIGRGAIRLAPRGKVMLDRAKFVTRIRPMDMAGVTKLAGAGGATLGAVGQGIEDAARGKFSGPKAYVAAAVDGAVGGVVGRFGGATAGGAASGATASVSRSLAEGKAPSAAEMLEGAREGALFGRVAGGLTGAAGKYGSTLLSPRSKGQLGEALSLAKTIAREGKIPRTQVPIAVGGRTTIADQVTRDGLLEAKFGRWAKLTEAQLAAAKVYGDKYMVDHFQPDDVGRILGLGASVTAGSTRDGSR